MRKLKSVITIWIIVYFLITGLMYGMHAWLIQVPVYQRTLILSGMMVFSMQYLIMPSIRKFQKN